jgi:hypothetical protein
MTKQTSNVPFSGGPKAALFGRAIRRLLGRRS